MAAFDLALRELSLPLPAQSPETNLAAAINSHAIDDPQYWDFSNVSSRAGGHAFFQYPAMMVPELQGALLDDLIEADPSVSKVYDPFMGSGTILLEAGVRGLEFHGTDINPLAVLLCQVKAEPPSQAVAAEAGEKVLENAKGDSMSLLYNFTHRDKWFTPAVIAQLSKLRRAIQMIEPIAIRRYLWICLAETVRLVSNSRISTFKLHMYDSTTLASRSPNAFKVFDAVCKANSLRAEEHWAARRSRDFAFIEPVLLRGDATDAFTAPRSEVDVIMTSPPYGDNHTTVPYGQHSYLPLCWIDHSDLVGVVDPALLATPSSTDSASLGGSRRFEAGLLQRQAALYPSLAVFASEIASKKHLAAKVSNFIKDYSVSLDLVSERLRPGGYSFFTLGQRRVGGFEMPLVSLTQEILEASSHAHVTTVTRRVRRKRMASKNSLGLTMATEQVLVMRKAL